MSPSAQQRNARDAARRSTFGARSVLLVGGVALIALVATGCGKSTSATPPDPSTSATAQGGTPPAASGKIAQVTASYIEVQSTDVQTTVNYNADTVITAQVATTSAAVITGACVSLTSEAAPTVSPGTASTSAAPVTASTVQIIPTSNGTCSFAAASGFAGLGAGTNRAPGSGGPTNRPSARPSVSRSGGPGAFGRGGAFGGTRVIGTVVSVAGSTVVVDETTFSRPTGSSASASPTPSTQPRTVVLAATTTYTTTQKSTAAALVTGQCAIVQGPADSTGAVTATDIAVTDPVNGSCFGGRTGGNGFGRNGFGSPTGGSSTGG